MSGRYSKYVGLDITLDGPVLTVMLNDPPMNSPSPEAHDELGRIWADASADPQVRVIVLTGAGDKAFSAGGNINRMVELWGDRGHWQVGMAEARALIVGALECTKPVISRINGHAMGLGASVALTADITVMVDDAKIGDPHVKVGLATGDGGALLWPNLVGIVEARRHLLTGIPLSGAQAAAKGLVTEAVPRAELDAAVQRWVDALLALSPSAVQTTKRALNLAIIDQAKAYMGEMLRLETRSWTSVNHREAATAIAEKRNPNFIDE
ncbi:enoyl-CoA hydratase/isomerase family protein [Novosphingobium taihuense]|uniref:Enoyl-CoA hydratase n=1 Tax=Novosphingobium taihuense TaxID=260085 RepID=A0A7W7EVW0_9SPHN|nr:enoyl-CoA hydratase-related protein [Novosphingobium taihuense]MBB4615436.1 enoyl-CoA hydratase [Novosphingobium taihuense]TWH82116.1 enoyl-CoA hydratase [Novosphingobium taihuense]